MMTSAGDDTGSPEQSRDSSTAHDSDGLPSDSDPPGIASTSRDSDPPPTHHSSPSDEDEWVLFTRDIVTSVLAVVLVGAYLFLISGVWPPMVAVESGSMDPNMEVNDLVFVMDTDRFQPSAAQGETGVVPADNAEGYATYGDRGDVIVFAPQGNEQVTPVIHRAMYWVDEGENWYDRANQEYIDNANSCDELHACPAPHDGFITKGDANSNYDQASGQFEPVKSEWVIGTAEVRVPGLGWLRLQFQ